MIFKLKKTIIIKNLIKKISLNSKYYGNKNIMIKNFCSIMSTNTNSLSFLENDNLKKPEKIKGIVILKNKNPFIKNQIITKNTRLFFIKAINLLFSSELKKKNYPNKNFRDHFIKKKIYNTVISENVFLGENVVIGKNCYIGRNVVIYPGTKIADNVVVMDNTVLGIYGLGYVNGILMPHIGNLIIKKNVKLGSNCTLVRGTLENTIIGEAVKIGNNVNIGHNVKILSNTYVSSSTVIAGGAKVESNCQLAAGVSIKNNLVIARNSKIGIGSVVVKNVKKNSTIFGNPGKTIFLLGKLL